MQTTNDTLLELISEYFIRSKGLINLKKLGFKPSIVKALSIIPISALTLFWGQGAIAGSYLGDVRSCPADRPCFTESYQSGNKIIFRFDGIGGWDFYNVRYNVRGGGEKQVENHSGSFTFNNVQPNRVYTISVQGCNSRFLRSSVCSPWAEENVTTN